MTNTNLFEVKCRAGHTGLVRGEDAEVLVRIDIELADGLARVARRRASATRFCMVLDASDSMNTIVRDAGRPTGQTGRNADGQVVRYVEGGTTKLQLLVDAARRAVALAKPGDHVTVIPFSATVGAPVTADGGDQAALWAAIDRTASFPHGSTNMTAALDAAMATMSAGDAAGGAARTVLLFTDGMPDEDDGPRDRAERLAAEGVSLSVLGFGDDLRVSYIEELAARGRGAVYSTRDPDQLAAELAKVFDTAKSVVVANLRADFRFAPSVTPRDLHLAYPQSQLLRTFTPGASSAVVPLPTIGGSRWITLFVRLLVKGDQIAQSGTQGLFEVKVTGDQPAEKRAGETFRTSVALPIVGAATARNHAVDDAFGMVQALGLSAQFEAHCRAGRYPAARDAALQARRIYESIASPEAEAANRKLVEALALLARDGHISAEELNRALNDVTVSRTASGVNRSLASQTRGGRPPDGPPADASRTRRAGW